MYIRCVAIIGGKEFMDLKEKKEKYMEGFGRRKGRGK